MKWFGPESWGAPVCAPEDRVEIPIGRECLYCETTVQKLDCGVIMPFASLDPAETEAVYHHTCLMKSLGLSENNRSRPS